MTKNLYTFISGTTYEVFANSRDEAEKKMSDYFDDALSDDVAECEAMTDFYGVQPDSWHEPNQTTYTLEQLQTCYETADLIKMLRATLKDGYTGLSLGLVIDLIKRDCIRVA